MNKDLQTTVEKFLTAKFNQEVLINNFASVGGGCINHGMQIDSSAGTFFLKYNSSGPKDLFEREAESLNALHKSNTQLIVPQVLVATQILPEQTGVLILEFLKSGRNNQNLQDEQLGIGLAQLHRNTNDQFGFYHNNYCGRTLQNNTWNSEWVTFYGEQRIWHLVQLIEQQRGMSSQDKSVYAKLVEILPDLLDHQPSASLTHGDLWSGNYLYTERGPALIDPASHYADRECDLGLMAMFGGFSEVVWSAYQNEFPLPPGWKERSKLYQLYHYLNHYYLFGGQYGTAALNIARRYVV